VEKLRNLLAYKFAKMHADWWQEKREGVYSAMADECIRQMEWATREGRDFESLDILDKPKLTIAPDDWKPE